VPPVVAVLLWKFFYDASPTGVFNVIAGWFGLGPFPWLQDATSAMPSLVLEATWAAAGGTVIIYLAALVGVRTELYEAAEVDGAGVWRKIWHVTLPQLRGVLFITLILQIIGTSQVFLEPFLFTGGGPANATLTILMLIYDYAFGSSLGGNDGAATALSLMLAGVLAVLSAIYYRAPRPWSSCWQQQTPPSAASSPRTTGAGRPCGPPSGCSRAGSWPACSWSASARSSGSPRRP